MTVRPAGAYEVLAAFYDELMAHVDYPLWADFVRGIWARHGEGPLDSAFDAACGTGRFLHALHEKGMRLAGCDGSAGMAEVARRRLGGKAAVGVEDLRRLPAAPRAQLVTCLYDSINYLTRLEELGAALEGLARLALPGGLVVFDICTERNSLAHFADRTDEDRCGEWEWRRHSWYERASRTHHNDFLVEHRPSRRRWMESHVQRIYRVDEVEALLEGAGMRLLARYAEFSFRPGNEDADRVHFVARPRRSA